MKSFIVKTIVIAIITASFILLLFSSVIKINKVNADFTLNKSDTLLMIGHSHSACAVNDAMIDHLCNVSHHGEAYFWMYPKMKQIIKQNPQIKVVFIEFSNNQIEESKNYWIWGDDFISRRLWIYYPFLEYDDISILYANNKSGFIQSISKTFRRNLTRLALFDFKYSSIIGHYSKVKRKIPKEEIVKPEEQVELQKEYKISDTNITYLEKTIALCNENDIKVYLVRMPQHKYYTGRNNEEIFQKIVHEKFANTAFLDFNDYPLADNEFGDLEHLNYLGAEKFSTYFNSFITNRLSSIQLTKK